MLTLKLKSVQFFLNSFLIEDFFDLHLEDIVQPKKRGVKRVTNRFVLLSYTIADIFFALKGILSCF
jgi:hypothetical protein